jgi:hypothetical protein
VTVSVVEEAGYGRLETTALVAGSVVEQRAPASVVETPGDGGLDDVRR